MPLKNPPPKVNSATVVELIKEAEYTLNDQAAAYLSGMQDSEREYGEEGLKLQIAYFFNNVRCKTPLQTKVKKLLMRVAKD